MKDSLPSDWVCFVAVVQLFPEKWTRKFDPCFDPYGVSRGLTGADAVDFYSLETPSKAVKVAINAR